MKILVGADPEVFVSNIRPETGRRAVVSAHGMIPGTKEEPHPVKRGAVQVDGMALEFNINPATSEFSFLLNIKTVMSHLEEMIPKNAKIEVKSSHMFNKGYIDGQPLVARELGCDPDFNAWTREENPRPNPNTPLRTAAGHVHIGWTKDQDPKSEAHYHACVAVARAMDGFLGVMGMILDPDHRRQQLYGSPGAFRPKPYGCEYRVLSNFWLKDVAFQKMVYSQVQKGMKWVKKPVNYRAVSEIDEDFAINVQNEIAIGIKNMSHWMEMVRRCDDVDRDRYMYNVLCSAKRAFGPNFLPEGVVQKWRGFRLYFLDDPWRRWE